MPRGMVCVIECDRGQFNSSIHNCGNQSHFHVHISEARLRVGRGEFEWVKEPASRSDKGVVRIMWENASLRGLSCKVGGALATALHIDKEIKKEREPWAEIMLLDIRRRVVAPADETLPELAGSVPRVPSAQPLAATA